MANDFKIMDDQNTISVKKKKTGTGIIGLLIKSGLVKTASQANVVLILFVLVGISAIVYLNLQTFGS